MKKLLFSLMVITTLTNCTPPDKKNSGGGQGGFQPSGAPETINLLKAQEADYKIMGKTTSDFYGCSSATTLETLQGSNYVSSYKSALTGVIQQYQIQAAFERSYSETAENQRGQLVTNLISFTFNGNNVFQPNTYTVRGACNQLNCDFLSTDEFLKGSKEQFARDAEAFGRKMADEVGDEQTDECEFEPDLNQIRMTVEDGTYEGLPAFRIKRHLNGQETCPNGKRSLGEVSLTEVRLKDEYPINKQEFDGFEMGLEEGSDSLTGDYCQAERLERTLVQVEGWRRSQGQIRFRVAFRVYDLKLESEATEPTREENR